MTEFTFKVGGMTCESCAKVIEHAVGRFPNASLKRVDTHAGTVTVDCEEGDFNLIKAYVAQKGYDVEGFERQPQQHVEGKSASHRVKRVIKGVIAGEPAFAVERRLLGYTALSLALLFVFDLAGYFAFFKSVPKFWTAYAPFLALVGIGTVANVAAYFHFKSFKTGFSCMSGMMIGMTLGMISGFMLGAIAGAANGMLVGSVVGMFGGMAAGAITGKCCGVMGIMEGLMAGIMSGTMGAMLSIMLLADGLLLFLAALFAALVVILVGLGYMMYKEAGDSLEKNEYSFAMFFSACFIITMAVNWLVVYGPRSGVFWTG